MEYHAQTVTIRKQNPKWMAARFIQDDIWRENNPRLEELMTLMKMMIKSEMGWAGHVTRVTTQDTRAKF